MRYQLEAPILAHEQLAEYEFEITLDAPKIASEARPGQFLQVLYDQTYNPFTRRPFSVYRVDPAAGTFSIVYLARGVFTLGLRNKRPGQTLSVIGPLGNWFEAPTQTDHDRPLQHVMVAGGVGAPPLYFLAERLTRKHEAITGIGAPFCDVAVVNGARTRELLVGLEEFSSLAIDLHCTTDDGSFGTQGIVTDRLSHLLKAAERDNKAVQVYTCGPTAMMRAVAAMCDARNAPCQVSLETMMPCGLGVCMGCVVKVRNEQSDEKFQYIRACYEGPVFNSKSVLWE